MGACQSVSRRGKSPGSAPAPAAGAPAAAPAAAAPAAASSSATVREGLLSICIVSAANLRAPWRGDKQELDPFVVVEHGLECFRATTVRDNPQPIWNEELRIWVRPDTMQYKVLFQLFDDDTHMADDSMGTKIVRSMAGVARGVALGVKGFAKEVSEGDVKEGAAKLALVAKQNAQRGCKLIGRGAIPVGEFQNEQTRDVWISLHRPRDDEGLVDDKNREAISSQIATSAQDLGQEMRLHLKIRFIPIEQFRIFTQALVRNFDGNGNGSLSKVELESAIMTLGGRHTDSELEELFANLDKNKDGGVDAKEFAAYLESEEFQSHPLTYQLLAFVVDGEEGLSRLVSGIFTKVESTNRGDATVELGTGKWRDMTLTLQDRESGVVLEEFIPSYIKIGIQLMYTSTKSMTDSASVRGMLERMSRKEGKKMDSAESKSKIKDFVKLHNLNTEELLVPIDQYQTFNEFFYRKLKPGARPITAPGDNRIAVSPADCRMTVWPTIQQSQKIWIKGTDFTIGRLLGPRSELASQYDNGSLCIARLAPQDYHRFHFAVSGKMVRQTKIDGTLFTVNPIAVRGFDVYTENSRVVCEIETAEFGLVIAIAVGATMVGSIVITAQDNTPFTKGDEHGYFAFGGSTVLYLFQKDKIRFDEDLVSNSSKPLETLVRVGMRLGEAL